jgi:hypothetical protein
VEVALSASARVPTCWSRPVICCLAARRISLHHRPARRACRLLACQETWHAGVDSDACPVLALSEDPIAVVASFFTFVRSIVDILLSAVEQPPASTTLPTGFTYEENDGERPFLLARLTIERGGASTAVPRAKQGSAMLPGDNGEQRLYRARGGLRTWSFARSGGLPNCAPAALTTVARRARVASSTAPGRASAMNMNTCRDDLALNRSSNNGHYLAKSADMIFEPPVRLAAQQKVFAWLCPSGSRCSIFMA